eukprot:GSChrysophyteH1.ASY1.ANO1.2781.1 assembled CDS
MGVCTSSCAFLQKNKADNNSFDLICADAWEATTTEDFYSQNIPKAQECKIVVTNDTNDTVYLCWIDSEGLFHHYEPILPKDFIQDGSVSHVAVHYTIVMHSFCFYRLKKGSVDRDTHYTHVFDVPKDVFVCLYRPLQCGLHGLTFTGLFDEDNENASRVNVSARVDPLTHDSTQLIDNSGMRYEKKVIAGFLCLLDCKMLSDDVKEFLASLLEALYQDLEQAALRMPLFAVEFLQQHVQIYINKDCTFGAVSKPESSGMCYHPTGSASWLSEKGLSPEHELCIEIFNAASYLESRCLWGVGGLFIHELSHSYHDQYLPNGYNNKDILASYNRAIDSGTYDHVMVKKFDGINQKNRFEAFRLTGPKRGYQTANCMEYFAELSTAFMCEDSTTCYNKWQPFNRCELAEMDAHAEAVLRKAWGIP